MASELLEIALSCLLLAGGEKVALNHGNIKVSIGIIFLTSSVSFSLDPQGTLRIRFASVCLAGFGMLPVVRCC